MLSRLEDKTAIDPENNPAQHLLNARTNADTIANREALYFMSIHYSFSETTLCYIFCNITHNVESFRIIFYVRKQTKKSLCPAAYYHDLTAEQIALVCKLRRNIESFFAWWKHHIRVYHLIARTPYNVMVQMLGGLIT
jgi:hypothetical protein